MKIGGANQVLKSCAFACKIAAPLLLCVLIVPFCRIDAVASAEISSTVDIYVTIAKDGSDIGRDIHGYIYVTDLTGLALQPGTDVTDWFESVPDGLSISLDGIIKNAIRLRVNGVPAGSVEQGRYTSFVQIPANTLFINGELYSTEITPAVFCCDYHVADHYEYIDTVTLKIDPKKMMDLTDNGIYAEDVIYSDQSVDISLEYSETGENRYFCIWVSPKLGYKFAKNYVIDLQSDYVVFHGYSITSDIEGNESLYRTEDGFGIKCSINIADMKESINSQRQGNLFLFDDNSVIKRTQVENCTTIQYTGNSVDSVAEYFIVCGYEENGGRMIFASLCNRNEPQNSLFSYISDEKAIIYRAFEVDSLFCPVCPMKEAHFMSD